MANQCLMLNYLIYQSSNYCSSFWLVFLQYCLCVKVLEDKGDMSALYGKIAIGILVMQDIFAVIFLAVSEGKYPSIFAFLVLLLFLPHVRRLIYKLIDQAGYGELLVVTGLFFALVAGYEFFYSVDLKGDLGANTRYCYFKSP